MNGSEMVGILWKQVTGLARQYLATGFAVLDTLRKRVPRAQLVLWGASVLLLTVWWFEHQTRLRQAIELEQLQKQTTTAVSALKAQAASAIRDANVRNAEAIHEFEGRRSKLEGQARDLAAHLQSLQEKQRAQTAQVAALPAAELARRVADELGSRESELSNVEPSASGLNSSAPTPYSQLPTPALTLSDPQLRNLAAALVERDACREQKQAVADQFENCLGQRDTNAAIIQQQVDSLAKLNQALSAKDAILTQREIQQTAELKAARGSRLARLERAVEWAALGIVIGVVIR